MQGPTQHRLGFTLVELLTIIAIIGILTSLLLPAVQSARESARRVQCSGNLKQIALAYHSYHDTHKAFPPGNIAWNGHSIGATHGGPEPVEDNTRWYNGMWGWAAFVLPFTEAQSLYDQFDFNTRPYVSERSDIWFNVFGPETAHGAQNLEPSKRTPPLLICPSTPSTDFEGEYKDYAVNGGQGENPATPAMPLSACCPERANRANGIGYKNSSVSIAWITDGTANTFLLLEQAHAIPTFDKPVNPFVWVSHLSQGIAISNEGARDYPPNPSPTLMLAPRAAGGWGLTGRCSWSFHPSGVQVAMADGNVRFINETIGLIPWRALHSRDGGEIETQ